MVYAEVSSLLTKFSHFNKSLNGEALTNAYSKDPWYNQRIHTNESIQFSVQCV
jgi:hypothetical protein